MPFAFDHSYARLPERFYARVKPSPVAAPRLLAWNEPLAKRPGHRSVTGVTDRSPAG